MSSGEILALIRCYEGVVSKMNALSGKFDECVDVVNKALAFHAFELVINKKPLLENKYSMKSVNAGLSESIGICLDIVGECSKKIDELWVAYYAALEAERLAAEKNNNI